MVNVEQGGGPLFDRYMCIHTNTHTHNGAHFSQSEAESKLLFRSLKKPSLSHSLSGVKMFRNSSVNCCHQVLVCFFGLWFHFCQPAITHNSFFFFFFKAHWGTENSPGADVPTGMFKNISTVRKEKKNKCCWRSRLWNFSVKTIQGKNNATLCVQLSTLYYERHFTLWMYWHFDMWHSRVELDPD